MKTMQIALFKAGRSTISRLIGWQTRSVYSHAALWFPEVSELHEAVSAGWVIAGSLGENHDPGQVVDLLAFKDPLTREEVEKAYAASRLMVGAPYDYTMVLGGFPLRLSWEPNKSQKKFFCSEGVTIACAAMGPKRMLFERAHPWEIHPEHVNICPLLKWEGSVVL